MRPLLAIALLSACLLALIPGPARAITASYSPSPTLAGMPVTMTATQRCTVDPGCQLRGNWSDGGGWFNMGGPCVKIGPATVREAVHIYNTPGIYNPKVMNQPMGACGPTEVVPPVVVFNFLEVQKPQFALQVSPNNLNLSLSATTTRRVLYRITTPYLPALTMRSDRGVFSSGGRTLGYFNRPLDVSMLGGQGTASEVMTMPGDVLRNAQRAGVRSITYARTFYVVTTPQVSDARLRVSGALNMRAVTDAMAPFQVTGVRLLFENNQPQITVGRNQPGLRFKAVVKFLGSGLLRGYWEVDGRRIGLVSQHLTSTSRSVTLEMPSYLSLPTFRTGTHRVRLLITNPDQDSPWPTALYFVTEQTAQEAIQIGLGDPADGAELEFTSTLFQWEGNKAFSGYLVQFSQKDQAVFSAYTRQPIYRLPTVFLRKLFSPGQSYRWQVKGLDSQGQVQGQSPEAGFRFR